MIRHLADFYYLRYYAVSILKGQGMTKPATNCMAELDTPNLPTISRLLILQAVAWSRHGMTGAKIRRFCDRLVRNGVYMFFGGNATLTEVLAQMHKGGVLYRNYFMCQSQPRYDVTQEGRRLLRKHKRFISRKLAKVGTQCACGKFNFHK